MYLPHVTCIVSTVVLTSALCASRAQAQCPTGQGPFHVPGCDGEVWAIANFDDGSGMALFVAGDFQHVGADSAPGIARWDGTTWTALPSGADDVIRTLEVFDDGSGAALYAGGGFTTVGGVPARGIARWNGSTWSAVGGGIDDASGFAINDMAVFDGGGGPRLYVTGRFDSIGGVQSNATARWNGSAWQHLGGGIGAGTGYAWELFDDGSGPALFLGGAVFNQAGPTPTNKVAKFTGTTWEALGSGFPAVTDVVYDLCGFDDGSGPQLYAVGKLPGFNHVARWNGSTWNTVAGGLYNPLHPQEYPRSAARYDDGTGEKLFVGGPFLEPLRGIATWDGASWSQVAGGLDQLTLIPDVRALHVFDDGGGSALFTGGSFYSAGAAQSNSIARYRAGAWSAVGDGEGLGGLAYAITSHPTLGGGPATYVAGTGKFAGQVFSQGVARWDGASWSALGTGVSGSGLTGVGMPGYGYALLAREESGGPALYVGGRFQTAGGAPARALARWDGASWSALGAGPGDFVYALAEFDDGSGTALYAGGASYYGSTLYTTPMLAQWDGASWTQIGGLTAPTGYSSVGDLAVFDAGSGPELYAAGAFTHAGGIASAGIARWDGSAWSDVGGAGLGLGVSPGNGVALTVFDDGTGAALYLGGNFQSINGQAMAYIAKWNGQAWSALGPSGANAIVYALAAHDDGTGPALYAGGYFTTIGQISANRVAKWDGASWSTLGLGADGVVVALGSAFHPTHPWPSLFVGGSFREFDGDRAQNIARWSNTCACAGVSYCTAGTTTNGCNAQIAGTGTPSASAPSGFVLDVTGVEGNKSGLIFYGLSGRHAAPWGSGTSFLCVKSPTQRTTFHNPGGANGTCDGVLSLDWNAWVFNHPTTLGAPFSIGQAVQAQGWFRDPPASKTTSLSDALEFHVCPR